MIPSVRTAEPSADGSPSDLAAPAGADDSRALAARRALAGAGFAEIAVAAAGDVARLSGPPAALEACLGAGARERVLAAVRGAGFRHVGLELADG